MPAVPTSASRILIIGGSGHLGRRVVAAMAGQGQGGCEIWTAGRSPGPGQSVHVDLNKPDTFSALDGFDLIVDCAASSRAEPDGLIEHCLSRGLRLIESSGDPEMIARSASRWRPDAGPGTVVLGMGLFPGLSNLVARDLIRSVPGCVGVDLAVRLNPFSGAGRALVELMTRLLMTDAVRYSDGMRQVVPALAPGPEMRFADGRAKTFGVGLPEPQMLHWSAAIANAAGWFSPRPKFLRVPLALIGRLARGVEEGGLLVNSVKQSLYALRGRLLRWRATPVELHAEAWDAARQRQTLSLVVRDGMMATAKSLAAAARRLLQRERLAAGVVFPDEAFELHEILQVVGARGLDWRLLSPSAAACACSRRADRAPAWRSTQNQLTDALQNVTGWSFTGQRRRFLPVTSMMR